MTNNTPSEKIRSTPDIVVRQTILEQAEAAAAAQTNSAGPTTEDNLLPEADLTTSDVPPPGYGEIYGEIRNEKNGLGTRARVTDDGRVNIRINQSKHRLSQIFTPALRQQVQSVQEDRPPPPPYVPPSLGGEEGVPPPPSLNVVIQVVGSRGDVQPFVALGKVLKETYGHRVRLATHSKFKDFVQENGLEFFSIGGDPSQLMAFMVKNPGLMPGFRSILSGDVSQRRKDVAEYIQGCWRSCYKAGDGMDPPTTGDNLSKAPDMEADPGPVARPFVADCIIANPPSFAHIHCAEKLGIPLHIMFTMPYSPTQAFPHPLANIQSSNADPQLTNYMSYAMIEVLSWQGLGDILNRFRVKCLGLDPVSLMWAPGMLEHLKVPHTYCWSPDLIPKPKDWGSHISISGFFFLNSASNYTPAPDLQAFLDAGPTPVYVGFGSIVLDDPNTMTEIIFEAVRRTGQRVLLSKGWGGMGADELQIPNGVFMLDDVPHDWLFKHVSCVVHHGGAGTTAAGIAAGRPTLVVPFFGDQPFWGAMVARAGAGPDPIPHKQLTADKLVDAINFCLKPDSLERAKKLASKIAARQGTDMGALSFHQYLEVDRLRCTLAPSRPATWRIKRTQVRLSAFAACTLANAKLLNFHDLKLFRPQEYQTDEGPWDPVSGGATALFGAFSSMVMGLADFPSETVKAFQLPFGSKRQQAEASKPTRTAESEATQIGERPIIPTSPSRIQTNLSEQDSLVIVQSPSSHSGVAPLPSNIGSSPGSDVLQGQSAPKKDKAGRTRVRSRIESSSVQDRDMLRQTGVHTSKGFGRIVKAAVEAPMEISVGLTKGFHNAPKIWGDETVRPQEQVYDLKSGAKAIGKEFGFGMYDGVTGLVTQPWKGAQKEGTSGFFKGIGKGIGGFATKPGAALFAIPSYFMKGVHKEVQKLFGSNVQNYIIASRTAQGYEEWLQSSDEEKQDVIVRWKLIRKYLKKNLNSEDMVRDVLEAQRKMNMEDKEASQDFGRSTSCGQSVTEDASTLDSDSVRPTLEVSPPNESLLEASVMGGTVRPSVQETSHGNLEEDAELERAIQENLSLLQRRQRDAAIYQEDQEGLRKAIAASEAEAQRHASKVLEHEQQLRRAMAQSLMQQQQRRSDREWESDVGSQDTDNKKFERSPRHSEKRVEKAVAVAGGSSNAQRPPSYDPGHLAGTTQNEFEAELQGQQGEKTTQERTEEKIVMEYVKKQSLLEIHHRSKGKEVMRVIEDKDDEDFQKALKLSMQEHEHEHEHDAENRYGEASGT